MAIKMDDLRKMLDKEGLKYFLAPDRPMVMIGGTGLFGFYQFTVGLFHDGQFLQFRTMQYLQCPADHPHAPAVLRLLGELDYQLRLVKFGWDPRDGEIMVYADHLIGDGKITQEQLSRMLHMFMPAIDLNYIRIKTTLEKGQDPGETPFPAGPPSAQVKEI
jgi:hypothetical protein